MENVVIYIFVSLVISGVVGKIGYAAKLLTSGGSTAAFLLCTLVGVLGSPNMLALFLVYAIVEIFAVRIGNCNRETMGVDFDERGERDFWDISKMMIGPLAISIIDIVWQDNGGIVAVAFITCIAVLAACTAANEFGIKDTRVWDIITFKKVQPGTDGSVSLRGILFATVAIVIFSILGSVLAIGNLDRVWIPIVCGVVGFVIDLIIGATLVRKRTVTATVRSNISCIAGALLSIPLCLIL